MTPEASESRRSIGTLRGITLVAGSMLGVGIFLVPPIVAGATEKVGGYLALWALGGGIAFCGATIYAELGAMIPHAGGDYAFLREGLGEDWAVAAGWVLWWGVFAGSIAAVASALFEYQVPALLQAVGGPDLTPVAFRPPAPLPDLRWTQVGAMTAVLVLTVLNVWGLSPSFRVLSLLTLGPLTLLVLVAVAGLLLDASTTPSAVTSAGSPRTGATPAALVSAYVAVYFAYSGWNAIAYVGGEVLEPERVVPRSLFWGTFVVTAVYLLLCAAFARTLGLAGLAQTPEAGSALFEVLFGSAGAVAAAAVIATTLSGSLLATVLTGARVVYALANDGALPRSLGRLHPRSGVPARALWVQALVSCLLIGSGGFEALLSLTGLAMQLLGGLVAWTLFRLRSRAPERPRAYRATGFPWLPGTYLAATVCTSLAMTATSLQAMEHEGLAASLPLWGLLLFGVAWAARRARRGLARRA